VFFLRSHSPSITSLDLSRRQKETNEGSMRPLHLRWQAGPRLLKNHDTPMKMRQQLSLGKLPRCEAHIRRLRRCSQTLPGHIKPIPRDEHWCLVRQSTEWLRWDLSMLIQIGTYTAVRRTTRCCSCWMTEASQFFNGLERTVWHKHYLKWVAVSPFSKL